MYFYSDVKTFQVRFDVRLYLQKIILKQAMLALMTTSNKLI